MLEMHQRGTNNYAIINTGVPLAIMVVGKDYQTISAIMELA